MFSGDKILARRFDTGAAVALTLRKDNVAGIAPADSAPDDVWIAPALFDPQVNGYAGVDFQSGRHNEAELLTAARAMRAAACGQFFLTLTSALWAELIEHLKHLYSIREKSSELKSAIAGWHIEGPFLSAEPGYHGAHDPAVMLDPTPERIRELRNATGNDPLLLTVAPERAGAIDAIKFATSQNIRISLGHTNASAELIAQAVNAGATGFTHLANGCTQALDRHDNILWRVCDNPGLTASLIPDSIHVSPQCFRVLHAALPRDRICYTTDAMSAAGAPPGRYRLGNTEFEVGADRIVRQPGKTNFAGSALRPIDGVFTAAKMLGVSWRECWTRASIAARKYAGLSIKPEGAPFCVMQIDGSEFKQGRLYAPDATVDIQGG